MTIHISILGVILIILFLFLFLIIFRWIIITKSVLYYTSDLIDRVPDRYIELEITLIESLVEEFIEDDEQSTLDIDTFIIVGNSSLFGEKINSLAEANNLNLDVQSDLDSSTTTIRFIKPIANEEDYEDEDDEETDKDINN